jgi:pimeloyl-ACP methyl ester carboxylesterase
VEKVKLNGIDFAFDKSGNGKTSIIFLHGNGENHKIFNSQIDLLSENNTCYAVDTRGHGESSFATPFTIEQFALDIIEFCKIIGIERAIFIGYSDGANILMQLAQLKPMLIEKMVLISGNMYVNAISKVFTFISRVIFCASRPFWFIRKIKRIGLLQKLMLDDIGITEIDLTAFNMPTLVIGAQKDLISYDHTKLISDKISNGILFIAKNSNHFNIVNNKETIEKIVEFVNGN